MKTGSTLFNLVIAMLSFCCNAPQADKTQLVNPILGDISYETQFGCKPTAATDNALRVKTHLAYVEDLLRQKDVSRLSPDLREKRSHLLDLLHHYWTTAVFPKNYDYAGQRKPCFIDKDGTICAVGYLVEQTAGRQVAESINEKYKYDEVLAMNDPAVDNWVSSSGLTKEECAMIQPTYAPPTVITTSTVTTANGISSGVLSGVNLSFTAINAMQLGKAAPGRAVPIIGLITGAGQVALGAATFPKNEHYFGTTYSDAGRKTLSMINIGLGTTTMIMSAWNLISHRKPKDKRTSWNLYSFPTQDNNAGITFSLTRKL